jgi:S1-C subfamily serine protease
VDTPTPHSGRYISALALAACLILSIGWFLRPRDIPSSPAPLPSESELAQLARRAERRSLDSMATYFAVTADDVESSIVHVPTSGASGVVLNSGTIVTVPLPRLADEAVMVQSAFGQGLVQPTMWGPRLPLAVLTPRGSLPGLAAARDARSLPEAGNWVLVVWRAGRERRFTSGSYIQSASVTCDRSPAQEVVSSLSLTHMMVGGGLFDIDGGLLAVILPCDDRVAAIATTSVAAILSQSDTDQQRVLAKYGLVLDVLADEEAEYFEVDGGVIVREVYNGYRGDEAGLMPGDIITTLNEEAVTTPDDLAVLARSSGEETLALEVRRGSTRLTITFAGDDVGPEPNTPAPPGLGVVWEPSTERYTIEGVIPGSRAALAGIAPGDRVVRIDHAEPRSLAQVRRVLADDRTLPVLLEIERADRRFAIVLR